MDKFTVDLEKVLDEFEYSEGREEAVLPPAIRNHSYTRNSPKPVRPPAAAYRRPTFEPISLADADFSADPSSVSGEIINVAKHKTFTEQKFTCIDENDLYPQSHPALPTFGDLNSLNKTDLGSNDQEHIEEHSDSPKPSEETPDLLDSNSLKSSQNGVDQENVLDKAQLPDITSVHSYSEPEEEIKTVEELDLIKRHSLVGTPDSDSSDDLPPIVGIDTVIKTNLPDLQVTPLTFDSVEIPDSDLVSYLDSLDHESCAINSISDNITDCAVDSKSEVIPVIENILCSNINEVVLDSEPVVQTFSSSPISSNDVNLNESLITPPFIESSRKLIDDPVPLSTNLAFEEELTESKAVLDVENNSVQTNHVVDGNNEDGPLSLSSDLDDKESRSLSPHGELDTKQKYSICPDISDEYPDEPEEALSIPDLSIKSEQSFTLSDINNGNVSDDLKLNLSETVENEVSQNETNEEQTLSQVLNLNTINESVIDTQKSEIKEVVCDSACDSGLNKNTVESDRHINRIIIRVPSESSDSNSVTEITNESVINQKIVAVTPDENEVNNSINDSISQTTQANSINETISNCVLNNTASYNSENSTFNTLTCLPTEPSTQVFLVDNISQIPQQSIECLDNTLNSNSDELVQNLQNAETERIDEETDNRDNEEKAELGLVSENSDASGSSEYFYQGDSSNSSEGTQNDSDMKPSRPSSLPLPHSHIVTDSEESPTPSNSSSPSVGGVMSPEERSLGKRPPYWVPDTESDSCMLCKAKFTVIKRRHHCRACGLVLCSKCCNLKAPLEYMGFAEARVCQPCFNIIYRDEGRYNRGRQPNPNNPMEYCSTVPPLQQVSTSSSAPPAVFVPTSVLKREGRARSDTPKQVMFSDGIRPGGDLTELDGSGEAPRLLPRRSSFNRKLHSGFRSNNNSTSEQIEKRSLDPATQSFIPASGNLPPMVTVIHGNLTFLPDQLTSVGSEPVKFAINYNLFINVKRVKLNCCVNREVWSVCSEGLCLVGQDEVAFILETLPEETLPHVDIFHLVNYLWKQAALGSTASEMCFTAWFSNTLLGSNDHGGFLYIRPSLQCTTNLLLPSQPYLIALLVHRWETGWARLFPLRLVLRLGAEYRYYPCPLVSVRNRQPLYTDIGHTIMKILADFRKFSYSLATVRGMVIHLEDKQTTILFPRNRYDQVTRALNNSNESVLAFGANLSLAADSHLVCIQGAKDENTYHTEAINIHNKPRKVTGASFVVFNGALKGSGDTGRSSILEDGLMVHLTPDRMAALRSALRSMHDFSLPCGPEQDETVLIHWTNDDTNFNVGVQSCIDGQALDGVPSIRVHNGTDYTAHCRLIRWTEVFILQCEDGVGEPVDVSRVSESISRATCSALVPLLDSLAGSDLNPLAIRATIHQENVGYEAGSRGEKLPSQYMKRLDDELVPVLHQAAMSQPSETPVVLELIFRIMLTP